ncbi:MAG: NADH-quinone oxidoreductase subunit J [Candidatus Hydrogenedentes bacterium]|nr:NADH-quinone oxidoreductase subunit J [Candidatus Hydrogenedentota bacterium]
MNAIFYITAAVAVVSTGLAITRANAIHSLLWLVTSLLAVSVIFFVLGAPFVAALEVIIYAGAIMVLFVFVIMMLNLGPDAAEQEREWLSARAWTGPGILALILLAEMVYILKGNVSTLEGARMISPKELSLALYGPYILVVELASLLLLAGLVGAYHLGRRDPASAKELKS